MEGRGAQCGEGGVGARDALGERYVSSMALILHDTNSCLRGPVHITKTRLASGGVGERGGTEGKEFHV